MRNIFIGILLFIGSVSAQYHPVNLKVTDSIKVGMSVNSVWFTNLFVESLKMTTYGRPYTLDGNPQYVSTDSLLYFNISAHDKDTFIVDSAVGFDAEATNYQLRYLEGLTYPTISTGFQALSSTDSNAFKNLKVKYDAPDDNTNIAGRLFSEFGIESVFNSDTTQIDSVATDSIIYYVSTSGSNSNTGLSEGQAWATTRYAVANAYIPTGDTVAVIALKRGDTFQSDTVLNITHSGTVNNNVIWDGSLWGTIGDTATIESTADGGTNLGQSVVRFVNCRYVTFQNIIVDGGQQARRGVVIGGDSDFHGQPDQHDEHNITIQNCEVKDVGSTISDWQPGILVRCDEDTISDIMITNNYIHNIAAHGIAIYANRISFGGDSSALSKNIYIGYNTIRNIRIDRDETGYGIHLTRQIDSIVVEYNDITMTNSDLVLGIDPVNELYNGDRYPLYIKNVTVRYNYFENTASDGSEWVVWFDPTSDYIVYPIDFTFYGNVIYAGGVQSGKAVLFDKNANSDYSGGSIIFYNNTVISTQNSTFQSTANVDYTIRNNIFYNTSTSSGDWAFIASGYTGITHTNNLYFMGASGSATWVSSGGTTYNQAAITGSYEGTAQNTNPTFTVDFTNLNLQTGSPAIDNGVAVAGYTEDRQGVAVVNPPNIGQSETTEDP